jgi:alanyl-tRNA synthetase
VGLRFEAEATGWLQNQSIALTDDSPKYANADVSTPAAAHNFTRAMRFDM